MPFRNRKAEDPDEGLQRILARLRAPAREPEIAWQVGDAVVATDGPFKGLKGTVVSVHAERHGLRAVLTIFGRETPIELHYDDAGKP